MKTILAAVKLWMIICLGFALFAPKGGKEGYALDVANSWGYYMGASLRSVYKYIFGLVF